MTPLVVVAGPTGAGKTELGVLLAERIGAEVISADAFAVYRGLDIGTAKPDADARRRVPHHLIDIADPASRYSAGMFIRDADAAIASIRDRGRIPVVVGGTMFYVRALLHGLFVEPPKQPTVRARLEAEWDEDANAVRERLGDLDPEAAARISPADRQRTLRALEVAIVSGRSLSQLWREHPLGEPRYDVVLLVVDPPRDELHARIETRVGAMFARGLLDEVRRLLSGGVDPAAHSLKAIGYRECLRVVTGEWTEAQARDATVVATKQLAKRQLTWLRREPQAVWLSGWGPQVLQRVLTCVEASGGARSGEIEERRR